MTENLLEISRHFTSSTDIRFLSGGRGESFRCGGLAFKPVYDEKKYNWQARVLEELDLVGIQYSRPVRSLQGNFVEHSYGATQYIDGEFYEGRMDEKVEAAIGFHQAIQNIPEPEDFALWTDPWTQAQETAWSSSGNFPPSAEPVKDMLAPLVALKHELSLHKQLIHCDLAGNILFNSKGPLVIDFSPGFFPADYGQTCLVTDSIAWHKGCIQDLDLITIDHDIKFQLVLRAVLFRVFTSCILNPYSTDTCINELSNFQPVISWLEEKGFE